MNHSPKKVYDNLEHLEEGDQVESATYRQMAQDVLADPDVSFQWREAIADRLNHANQELGSQTAGDNDSY